MAKEGEVCCQFRIFSRGSTSIHWLCCQSIMVGRLVGWQSRWWLEFDLEKRPVALHPSKGVCIAAPSSLNRLRAFSHARSCFPSHVPSWM